MRVGIYGGTFDPIHHGHLLLARDAIDQLGLDQLQFIPANHSPHKPHVPITPGPIRLEMIRAAIPGEPRFVANDIDLRRPPPSYAIDTIRALQSAHPGNDWFYLIGADNLPQLHTWREIDALRRLVPFVLLSRRGDTPPTDPGMPRIRRHIDITSTEIRNRIANDQPVRYLVPDPVETVIRRHRLYLHPSPPSPPSN